MRNEKTHIEKSFRIGMLILLLIVIAFLSIIFKAGKNILLGEFLIGLPLLISGILGIIGFIQGIKGRKEHFSLKKLLAFVINTGVVVMLIGLLIANVFDVMKAFS
jgi:membrane protease YdiL (CAAX protease family)